MRKAKASHKIAAAQPRPEVAALFMQGLALHQRGQLAQAQHLYDQVLTKQPTHFDALHLSGVIALQSRNPARAVELIDKAIKINPHYAAAYSNRGNALKELKRLEEAVASYDRAIAIQPDFAEVHSNRGVALKELQRAEEAIASYDRAISIKPDYAEAHNNRGIALKEAKRVQEAIVSYHRAIEIKPAYAEAHNNLGNALKELRRLDEAIASYDRAIEIKPDYAEAHSNRGNGLAKLNRFQEAVASFNRAIEFKPADAEDHANRGFALQELRCLEEALASCDRAIEIKPDYAEAHNNRGNVLASLNRLQEAVVSYDRAVESKPDYAEAHWNKSLALLLEGKFTQGWELFEWRWKNPHTGLEARKFPQSLWLGKEDISGKTILLHAEQGLGDTIQFCRYAKLVKERGARVLLEAPKALLGLLAGLAGVDELIAMGEALPAFDYHCPLLSLPLAFKTDLASIPSPTAYLGATTAKREAWAQRLGARKKPRLGLVWSGSTGHKNDQNRSLTLQQLLPHLPDWFECVSLQKEVREADRQVLASSGIQHYEDELGDFTDTAALCDLMDLVISVDTSVAHLAGAIGKTTWVLLPFAPDWRWLLERRDSPWYKSVTLLRQSEHRDWLPLMKTVNERLMLLK